MTDKLGDRLYNKDSLKARLKQSAGGINKAAKVQRVNQLDELTSSLGLLESGEFRVGNQVAPGSGFTGVRMVYPGVDYGGDLYNLVGVKDDVLQWGGRVSDGVFVAGAGAVRLDADGITIEVGSATANSLDWYDTAQSAAAYSKNVDTLGSTNVNGVETYGGSSWNNLLSTRQYFNGNSPAQSITEVVQLQNTPSFAVSWNYNNGAASKSLLRIVGAEFVINDDGENRDLRVEGDTDTHMIFGDASTDNVGIGESTPLAKLHVDGEIATTPQNATISSGAITATSRVIRLTSESGTSDSLHTVNGLVDGTDYYLEPVVGHTITITETGGSTFNLAASADFVMNNARDKFLCMSRGTTNLDEVSRSQN
jgi:hypothetical protein